jgi:hypothetical protein
LQQLVWPLQQAPSFLQQSPANALVVKASAITALIKTVVNFFMTISPDTNLLFSCVE